MDAVTYPDKKVINFISDNLVPLRVPSDGPTAANFKVKWTPTLVILDAEGIEHYRSVGFLPADEFIPWLLLGMATVHFELDRFPEAVQIFDRLLSDFPQSLSAPEAIFFKGVTGYKSTHEAKPLKQAHEKLQAQFPSSEWTKKASPYSLL
jgi:hypothetical protein